MPINSVTRVLFSLMKSENFSNENITDIQILIDQGANLIIRDDNGDNAFSLAIKSNKPDIITFFKSKNPEYFNNKVREMQAMWIIGKEKDGIFTAGEIDRTQMDEIEKGLVHSAKKLEGLAKGEIATQSIPKREGKAPTSYVLKKAIDYSIQHLREVIGARCYAYFSGSKGTIMAKTRLVTRTAEEDDLDDTNSSHDSLIFVDPTPSPKIDIGSRILPQSFTQYGIDNGPRINSNGEMVVSINDTDHEVKGYLSAMTVAKFIQDFDCDGFGNNDGYMITDIGIQNAKIDPGRALGCIDDLHTDITDISEGIAISLTYKIFGKEYRTFIPLEYIDLNNPIALRPELETIDTLLKHYYPALDVRDPVIGRISYAQVCASPKLYHEFAETIYDIVTCSEEKLYNLINYNLPESINHLPLEEMQGIILNKLSSRQQIMHMLYPREVEYMKIYREREASGYSTNFESVIEILETIPPEPTVAFDHNTLINERELRTDAIGVLKKLLKNAEMTKKDPKYQQEPDVMQRADTTISIISPFLSSPSLLNFTKPSISYYSSCSSLVGQESKKSGEIFR